MMAIFEGVAKRAPIIGFNLVEFMPSRDVNNQGALMASRVAISMLGLIAQQRGVVGHAGLGGIRMLIRLLIIIIVAAAVFYLLRRYKGGAKRLLPLILSPAILPYIKQVGLFLLRILFRR